MYRLRVAGEFTMAVARQMMPSHVERGRFGAGTTGCMGTGFPCKHSAMIPPLFAAEDVLSQTIGFA